MHEEIVTYLREHPDGVGSPLLAEVFLKFKKPDPTLAHTAISAILKKDTRCYVDHSNKWHAKVKSQSEQSLLADPLTAVFCLCDPARYNKRILFISLWNIAHELNNVCNIWLVDPRQFISDAGEMFVEGIEFFDKNGSLEDKLALLDANLINRIPIFLSLYDGALLRDMLGQAGYYLTDDYLTVPELFRASQKDVPRPCTIDSFLKVCNLPVATLTEVLKTGEAFATGVQELLHNVVGRGVETRDALEELGVKDNDHIFEGKEFSLATIKSIPITPGVYGFKNKSGAFIYIGKAKNLKRRLMSYFRDTDESPEKIEKLKSDSHTLITYQCGSELEALLYEYRLIRKHTPVLNSKIDIGERNGTFRPIPDCLLLLPHVTVDKIMSVWFRENQKIIMRPLVIKDFDESEFATELNDFFYSDKLPAEPTDFPEMELATRWVKSHRDNLHIVEVYNCADVAEAAEITKFSIRQLTHERKRNI